MGYLTYGSRQYEFDDETLAHLKVAITTKLRRHEGFLLSWSSTSEGRISIWLSREVALTFTFAGTEPPPLDHERIRDMLEEAARTSGVTLKTRDRSAA